MKMYGLDIETNDPFLTDKGVSWIYGEGEILCTTLYNAATGKKEVFKKWTQKVKDLLLDPDVALVGAKISYDIGWLEYEMGIQGQTKARLIDVIAAEGLLDEYGIKDLDFLGKKYLKRGKKKSELEAWCEKQGYKGDFRKHLKNAPWNLLKDYVADDGELPVLIYEKQLPLLTEQGLLPAFEIDNALLKTVLKMTQRGVRIDTSKKAKNKAVLERRLAEKQRVFEKEHGKVNLNSTLQLSKLFDKNDIPYRIKVVLKGRYGEKFGWADIKSALYDVNDIVRGFRRKKDQIVCFIDKKYKEKMCEILDDNGYMYTANPTIDKKYRASIGESYPVAKQINEITQLESILSKLLGDSFDRFIVDGRVYANFNVLNTDDAGTISGRLSSNSPNLQQIPSRGYIDEKTAREIVLAEICRELFIPEDGCWMFKIDYSQIEYRLLVHYAVGKGAKEARKRFNDNPKTDYHEFVMGVTGLERKPAKNINFGLMYGMGIATMMEAFGWTKEFAEHVYNTYVDALPYVMDTMKKVSEVAKNRGYIKTIAGRLARLREKDKAYTMLNRLNQGSAADIMKKAMVMADEEGLLDRLNVAITVHDELVGSVPKTEEGLADLRRLQEIMESCYTLSVPVLAEPEIGDDWYHVTELADIDIKKSLKTKKIVETKKDAA